MMLTDTEKERHKALTYATGLIGPSSGDYTPTQIATAVVELAEYLSDWLETGELIIDPVAEKEQHSPLTDRQTETNEVEARIEADHNETYLREQLDYWKQEHQQLTALIRYLHALAVGEGEYFITNISDPQNHRSVSIDDGNGKEVTGEFAPDSDIGRIESKLQRLARMDAITEDPKAWRTSWPTPSADESSEG